MVLRWYEGDGLAGFRPRVTEGAGRRSYGVEPLARLGNHAGHRRLVRRCHDVNAGDAGDRRQLLDQRERDALAFGRGIGGLLQPRDEGVGNDRPEQISFIQRADLAARSGAIPISNGKPRVASCSARRAT